MGRPKRASTRMSISDDGDSRSYYFPDGKLSSTLYRCKQCRIFFSIWELTEGICMNCNPQPIKEGAPGGKKKKVASTDRKAKGPRKRKVATVKKSAKGTRKQKAVQEKV